MAVTLPDEGANRSETAFTDSTEPNVFPALTSAPTLGSSTKTMSPSACWAWSVMPIVAEPPSALIHSCSLVYLRSVGKPMLSSLAFFRTLVERRRYNLRGDALPADFNFYFGSDLGEFRRHVCQRDVLLEERRGRARRHISDRLTGFVQNLVFIARDTALDHFESDEYPLDAFFFLLQQSRFADEVARLLKFAVASEIGFKHGDRVGNFVAVKRHLSFEPQSVARAQTAGQDAELFAGFHYFVPNAF